MTTVIGLIGIIVALVLFAVLVYKGWSSFWVAPLCALIVAVTNGINVTEAITTNYLTGLVDLITSLFSIVFLGAVLGKVFTDTGAASSIANTIVSKFIMKKTGDAQVRIAILALIIIAGLCTMGGIDGFVLLFTMFPVCMVVANAVDIPRRFVPAMLVLNCAFMAAPGAPQIDNIMTQAAFASMGYHVTSYEGLIPGIIASLIILGGYFFSLTTVIIKAKRNGEHFEYGQVAPVNQDEERKLPNFFVALLPLVAVFVCYTIIGLNIFFALLIGIAINLIFMGKNLPLKDEKGLSISLGKSIITSLNKGAANFPNALISIITPGGLAGVITATAVFGLIAQKLGGLNINYLFLMLVTVAVLTLITSSPPVAMLVGAPVVIGILQSRGIDMNISALARVCALASNTLASLPVNGTIIVALGLTGMTHKQSYKYMASILMGWTTVGVIVCAALLALFPGLA